MTDLFISNEQRQQKPENVSPEKLEDLKREAKREYARNWRAKRKAAEQKNPELAAMRRDKMRKWRADNPEKVRAYSERYWNKKALELMKDPENTKGADR